jgi:hypothetical protein
VPDGHTQALGKTRVKVYAHDMHWALVGVGYVTYVHPGIEVHPPVTLFFIQTQLPFTIFSP